jgi:mannose/cellobiose epimerase-like protein (N-acyl-D-glucosamine 2-epimerase family)
MSKNPRVKIGLRELAAQPSGPFVMWDSGDGSTKGFCARRQFSDVITYSVIYRTKEGQQRWYKIGHHGDWTPKQARDKAHQIRFAADNGKKTPRWSATSYGAALAFLSYVMSTSRIWSRTSSMGKRLVPKSQI